MLLRMDQGTRARRVITRSPTRTVGRFPSLKAARTIHWESQLERDFVYLLELDPMVLSYREQPETVTLQVDGTPRRYTPDFLVRTAAVMVVYEVKPADKVATPEVAALMACAAEHYAGRGMRYRVVTENEIRVQPYLNNVMLALRYQRHPVTPDVVDVVRQLLGSQTLSIGALADCLADARAGMAEVLALLATHWLEADLAARPLSRDTLVRLPGGR